MFTFVVKKQGVALAQAAADHDISHLNNHFIGEISVDTLEFPKVVINKSRDLCSVNLYQLKQQYINMITSTYETINLLEY